MSGSMAFVTPVNLTDQSLETGSLTVFMAVSIYNL